MMIAHPSILCVEFAQAETVWMPQSKDVELWLQGREQTHGLEDVPGGKPLGPILCSICLFEGFECDIIRV